MTKELYLINPPNPYNMKGFPGSLLSLDLWVRKKLPKVKSIIIDEENTYSENLNVSLERKIGQVKNPYFGITCTTATYQDALFTARVLKQLRPESTIILGGHHTEGQEKNILEY